MDHTMIKRAFAAAPKARRKAIYVGFMLAVFLAVAPWILPLGDENSLVCRIFAALFLLGIVWDIIVFIPSEFATVIPKASSPDPQRWLVARSIAVGVIAGMFMLSTDMLADVYGPATWLHQHGLIKAGLAGWCSALIGYALKPALYRLFDWIAGRRQPYA